MTTRLIHAVIDADHTAFHFMFRPTRHVGEDVRHAARQHAVAHQHFARGVGHFQRRRFASGLQRGLTHHFCFVGEHRLAIDIHDRLGRTENFPAQRVVLRDVVGKDDVALTTEHTLFIQRDDGVRILHDLVIDHQRTGQEGRNHAHRHRRNRVAVFNVDARTNVARVAHRLADGQIAAIKHHDLAGIDQVRVADLLAVHAPHFRPAPRVFDEPTRDAPQRIATNDGVRRRSIRHDLHRLGGRLDSRQGRQGGSRANEQREYNALHKCASDGGFPKGEWRVAVTFCNTHPETFATGMIRP